MYTHDHRAEMPKRKFSTINVRYAELSVR
jgi:hypothetical protein